MTFVTPQGPLQRIPLIGTPPASAVAVQSLCVNFAPFDSNKCAGHAPPSSAVSLWSVKLASFLPKLANNAVAAVGGGKSAANASPATGASPTVECSTIVGWVALDSKGQVTKGNWPVESSSRHAPNEKSVRRQRPVASETTLPCPLPPSNIFPYNQTVSTDASHVHDARAGTSATHPHVCEVPRPCGVGA